MTAAHSLGPTGTHGYTGAQNNNAQLGPNWDFMGSAMVDPRWQYQPGAKDLLGQVAAQLNHVYICLCDSVPSIKNAAIVAAAQGPVVPVGGSVAMTLASTNQISPTTNGNRAVSVPVVPYGSSLRPANAVSCLTLDPGHTIGTTSTSSPIVTAVGDIRLITPGQYVGIPGAGSSGGFLIARVVSKAYAAATLNGSGTITLDQTPATVVTGGPIMLMEWRAPGDFTGGSSVMPWYYAGALSIADPHTCPGRALTVTSNNAGDTGYSINITSYDIAGVPMHETISVTANGLASGKKAHKHIVGITLNKAGGGTPAGTVSVGTADIFGMSVKNEFWEYSNVFWAGAFVSANTGWTVADSTLPATATTGDVRGTYAVQSATTGSSATGRLAMFMSLPARQVIATTYNDTTPLFGVAQF